MTTSECQLRVENKTSPTEQLEMGKPQEAESLVEAQQHERGGWTKLLTFAGYGATVGSAIPGGYCVGVMNSPAVYMRAWCNETLISRYDWHLSVAQIDILWATIVSIFLVGGVVGSVIGAKAANSIGRKGTFLLCGALYIISAILFYTCRLLGSVELLMIGRFAAGFASGLTTTCLPMYLSEMAPLSMRGVLGVFCPMGLTAGVVVGQISSLHNVFGSAAQWHLALSFYIILVLICYAPMNYYPESPKWLYIVKQDHELARFQLKRLRGDVSEAAIAKEIADMESEANLKNQASSFGEVLHDPKLLLPLIIVCMYQGGQQLSGINAIFYYSVSIFRKAGLSAEVAEWLNLGAGSLNLLVALFGPMLMGRVNRRPLMLLSSFFCALFLLLFALLLYFIELVSWFAMGCVSCIFLYIFFFQFGVGPIPFFIGAELFDVSPRPVAMALGSLSSWGCNFLVAMTFPTLQNLWGSLVFLPFSVTCVIVFLLTKRYLPETRGRNPSQVAPLIANGFRSKVQ